MFWSFTIYPLCPPRLGHALTPDLVEEVDDDVVFLDAESVEVLPHRVGELVFALSLEFLTPRHCRRMQTDTARAGQNPLAVFAREGGWGIEAVGSTVGMKHFSLE